MSRTKQINALRTSVISACKRIAPAWPLKNIVAVNPYMGLSDLTFSQATQRMDKVAGINMVMPLSFYLNKIDEDQITRVDLKDAFDSSESSFDYFEQFLDALKHKKKDKSSEQHYAVTLTDVAQKIDKKEWNIRMIENVSAWASSYFNEQKGTWSSLEREPDLYKAWRSETLIDLSPKVWGIKDFHKTLGQLPENAEDALTNIIEKLDIPETNQEVYFHSLLLRMVGWSSYIAGIDWNNGLYEGRTNNLQSFLAILLSWELCMLESHREKGIEDLWQNYLKETVSSLPLSQRDKSLEIRLILQNAYDLASQRTLCQKLNAHNPEERTKQRPKAQAIFCIDVRSEVFRRNLEATNEGIETIGFAGFFGFPINYVPVGHQKGKDQCPALIPSGPKVKEVLSNSDLTQKASRSRQIKQQINKVWHLFKGGPVSSFGFVSPLGLTYLPKLLGNSLHLTRPIEDPEKVGIKQLQSSGKQIDLSEIPFQDKVKMASNALKAMGLTDTFAQLILVTGHGSTSVNNPHASGLDCGACGGHSGEINALTAATILNDPEVRKQLQEEGATIPSDTWFLACKHDTTTDEIEFVGNMQVPASHQELVNEIKSSLAAASKATRTERAVRLNLAGENVDNAIFKRTKDWSQVRPEWGLARCNAFIIAPRERTRGLDLEGRAFLHNYDWQSDDELGILTSIMTAPMVVTSWINLQYYASTVDNQKLGAGNKTIHNVTGGIGVLEGSSGDLRIGLPLQSLHDGKDWQHLPNRLNVVIEAPIEAINKIIEQHENIKLLFDNQWISLLALDQNGKVAGRYDQDLNWHMFEGESQYHLTKEELLETI